MISIASSPYAKDEPSCCESKPNLGGVADVKAFARELSEKVLSQSRDFMEKRHAEMKVWNLYGPIFLGMGTNSLAESFILGYGTFCGG